MNAEICTDYFSFVLLVLKYVEQLVPQITFSLFIFFLIFKKSKNLNLKLNQLYWPEFVSFRTVRTQNTQLLIGFQIGKKTSPKIHIFCFCVTLWEEKIVASCSFFFLVLNWSWIVLWFDFYLILFTIF